MIASKRAPAGGAAQGVAELGVVNVRVLLFVVCCAALSYGLFRPESPPEFFEDSDKWMHLLAFGALGLSARLAFAWVPGWLLWGLLLGAAPLLEWLQHKWQPYRQFSQADMLANLLGVLLAALACWLSALLWRYWRARRSVGAL